MSLTSLPLFAALTEKMRWHQTRQGLLAENIANAETPGYRGRDLGEFSFEQHLENLGTGSLAAMMTEKGHMASIDTGAGGFDSRHMNNFEITPEGNGVTLEDEMMKVTTNQMDYQAITTLYSRSKQLLRTALGRG